MKWLFLFSFSLFYIFFLLRAVLLSRSLKKSIKAKDALLNLAVLATGASALLFLLELFAPGLPPYLLVLAPGDGGAAAAAGLALIVVGLALSVAASVGLGRSWRIGIDPGEKTELMRAGIYRVSRNPYFLSYDLALLGTSLASLSVLVAAVSLGAMLMFHLLILKEERYLAEKHGAEYADYCRKVRRYL